MEPILVEKKNYTQTVITALLALVLLGIVGGYIYYGMWQANHMQPVVEAPVEPTAVESHQSLMVKDKLQILNDLAKEAESGTGTPATIEEKKAILNKLSAEASTETTISLEDKIKILNKLSTQSSGTETATAATATATEEVSGAPLTETVP